MEAVFSVVLVVLAFIFGLSGRRNLINRWCAVYLAFSSLGVIKEAFLFGLVPWLQRAGGSVPDIDFCIALYSVMTWAAYSFAAPAALVMGFCYCGLNHSRRGLFFALSAAVFLPAAALSFVYAPVLFRAYQLESRAFWLVYGVYNLLCGAFMTALVLRGTIGERRVAVRRHKITIAAIILPATLYALVTIFAFHPLGLERWFKAWQWNIWLVALSAAAVLVMVFRGRFPGLAFSAHSYAWDKGMTLAGMAADYTNHMLKNQASKMELCIEHLQAQYAGGETPEELAILRRSIESIKDYTGRMRRQTQALRIHEEQCELAGLLRTALPPVLCTPESRVKLALEQPVCWLCDKGHMTEVFANIFTNAAEAMRGGGSVTVTGRHAGRRYILDIADTGEGMTDADLQNIFTPYFTTKSTERNFGLGLSYCKNVVTAHGGHISAKSAPGKGTVVTLALPRKRVTAPHAGEEAGYAAAD